MRFPIQSMQSSVVGYWGAVLVVLLAPFDTLAPVLWLPGQNLTSGELVLVVVLGLWGLAVLLEGGRRRTIEMDLLVPLVSLWIVMAVSACFAAHSFHSWRFVGRFSGLILVYLLVARVTSSTDRMWGLLKAASASGLVVSLLGIQELLQRPWVLRFLENFREDLFLVGVQPRVSSTLQYPTITAMLLEIAFCASLGILLRASQAQRWALVLPLLACQTLIGSVVVLTQSRAACIVLFLVLAATLVLWGKRRGMDGGFGLLLIVLFLFLFVFAGSLALGEEARLRWKTVDQEEWYRVGYDVPDALELGTGEVREIEIKIRNLGEAFWVKSAEGPFRLAYHWYARDGQSVVDYEGLRTPIPGTVAPGEVVTLRARVQAPRQPGEYLLVWDMLREGYFWFSRETSGDARTRVRVSGREIGVPYARGKVPDQRFRIRRLELWSLALRMLKEHPVLGVGPDNFRLMYGDFAGFPTSDESYHTHNLFIEFFVNTGLIGGVLFVWLTGRCARLLKAWWQQGTTLPALVAVSAAAGAILMHGMVDFFLGFTPAYVMIAVTLGLMEAGRRLSRSG